MTLDVPTRFLTVIRLPLVLHHYCPVRSRIESTGCRDRVNRYRKRVRGVPAKWAFFQKV
jgi:hypothetical protein